MKIKPMVFIIPILAVAMFTGCGGSEGTSEPDQSEAAKTEQGEEVDQEVETEGMGNLLSATYVDMMKNNEYLMSYKASIDFEGQSTEVESGTIDTEGQTMVMDILEMSNDVPASMFEIPAEYEEMEL